MKTKKAEKKEWRIPYKATFRGVAMVSAVDEEAAVKLVEDGYADDEFLSRAERVDWEIGEPTEDK